MVPSAAPAAAVSVGASSGSYRVYRGGSWSVSANFVRAAIRFSFTPSGPGDYSGIGFRLARSVP